MTDEDEQRNHMQDIERVPAAKTEAVIPDLPQAPLLPCPFCGGAMEEVTDEDGHYFVHPGRKGMERADCWLADAWISDEPTGEGSIGEWNTRATVAPCSEATTDAIRAKGWSVAVHNDYRLNGEFHTFWLFTKDGRAIKGEGKSDAEALAQIAQAIDGDGASPLERAEAILKQIDNASFMDGTIYDAIRAAKNYFAPTVSRPE